MAGPVGSRPQHEKCPGWYRVAELLQEAPEVGRASATPQSAAYRVCDCTSCDHVGAAPMPADLVTELEAVRRVAS
jgi:hypothetical protein